MLKWERKLIESIDRYLPQLVWILVTLIALFIRRGGLWHVSFDFGSQFYTDDPGYLHTPFYTMFIWLVSHIPVTPIRTVKMIISLFDFGVAAAAVVLIRDRMVRREGLKYRDGLKNRAGLRNRAGLTSLTGLAAESNTGRLLVAYALLLISPVVIENGLTWIHMDSICFFAVLCALIAWNRKKNLLGWILLGAAAALQMQYGVLFIAAVLYFQVKKHAGRTVAGTAAGLADPAGLAGPASPSGLASPASPVGLASPASPAGLAGPVAAVAVIAGLNVAACIWSGTDWLTGMSQLVNWLIINPATGEVFGSLSAWFAVMAAQYAYVIAVSTLMAIFLHWGGSAYLIWTAAGCHLVLTIYLGWILQYAWVLP